MARDAHRTGPGTAAPSTELRLRGAFITLVSALLVAVAASTIAGLAGLSSLDQALREIAARDVQRLLHTTHVRRLFRSELVLVHELDGAGLVGGPRRDLEERRRAIREERATRLAMLRSLSHGDHREALRTLEEQHRLSTGPAFRHSVEWETAIASILAETEARLGRAAANAESRGRNARTLLFFASTFAAALALALGVHVLRRLRAASRALHASEEQLRQAQKMESVGRLAGGVAHDFNNLLTAIRGYASLARLTPEDGAAVAQYVDGIVAAADRAAALTRQLLAFSRKHPIAPVPTALDELIHALEPLLARVIGEDVRLEVRATEVGTCLVDVSQVEQVILNLVVNARDAMPAGGTLRIEARNVELGEGATAAHPELTPGPFVMLAVSDTGVGMSKEVRSRLFEPFFTTKPRGVGTGLGLSVVYGVVEQHGGCIEVETEPGVGTTFRVYWPRTGAKAVAALPSEGSPTSPGGSESVLLVEDDPLVRGFTADALAKLGYRVQVAADAAEATRLASERERPPDLLMTDVVLPDRDGRLLARDLTLRWPRMPVLFCSGYAERLDDLQRPAGGLDYLQKPYDLDTLARRVRAAIESARRGPS